MEKLRPDYKRIYHDMINKKYPDKKDVCNDILNKPNLSALDVIELNKKVFGTVNKSIFEFNQKHRSYNKSDICQMLSYQKKYKLNNSQLADHFKLSRNTVARWKKMFLV